MGVTDYKTGNHAIPENITCNNQMVLYGMAVHHLFPECKGVLLALHDLPRNRRLLGRCTPEVMAWVREQVLDQIAVIEAETEFPGNFNGGCRWCEFSHICPDIPKQK